MKIKKKQLIIDDARAKEPVTNENLCGGRHSNCKYIVDHNQNLVALDRRRDKEICNLFIFFEQKRKSCKSHIERLLK